MRRCLKCETVETLRDVRDRYVRTVEISDGTALQFVFEDLPQLVCSSCDERYYAAKDLDDAMRSQPALDGADISVRRELDAPRQRIAADVGERLGRRHGMILGRS